ncbi:MAG: long-chain fatty acid transport protein [Saprospiraceae bacterium]|nr:long-chain fatty acid transport protein [Saprospiraceae bacterium]
MKKYHLAYGILLIIVGLATGASECYAQEGHFWTQQYGTKSMLLSNSVIGGVEDLGAVYYNPARLGLIKNPSFLISANVYEWNRYKLENAFGENKNANKSNFGGIPSLIAGSFNLSFLKKHTFAYAVLLRQNFDMNVGYSEEVYSDVIDQFPGEEYFGGSMQLRSTAKEQWFSLAWSYPINERLSVGITTNASILDVGKGSNFALQALSQTNDVVSYQFAREISYLHYGLIWKAGLASTFRKIAWGLTLTTPVIALKGRGDYTYDKIFTGIDSSYTDEYTTSRQFGLGTKRHTPLSVGFGFTVPIKRSRIHFSTEWFSDVKNYTILEARDHVSQSTGDTIRFRLTDRFDDVINVGVGAEIYIRDEISFYASLCSDFSAIPENLTGFSSNLPTVSNSTFTANLYHFAGGIVLNVASVDLTLGATITGGKQGIARPVNFPIGDEDDIFDTTKTATLEWDRLRFVFSISVPFFDKKTREIIRKTNN